MGGGTQVALGQEPKLGNLECGQAGGESQAAGVQSEERLSPENKPFHFQPFALVFLWSQHIYRELAPGQAPLGAWEPQHQEKLVSHLLSLQLAITRRHMQSTQATLLHKAHLSRDWKNKPFQLIQRVKHRKSCK